MAIRLRLKRGDAELEYEGDAELLADHLSEWIGVLKGDLEDASVANSAAVQNRNKSANRTIEATASAIASAIGARTGPDLFKCALAYYQLAQGQERATRSEILAQMKLVSHVYRTTMSSNLSNIIRSLLADRQINEPQQGVYCLTSDALASISHTLPR